MVIYTPFVFPTCWVLYLQVCPPSTCTTLPPRATPPPLTPPPRRPPTQSTTRTDRCFLIYSKIIVIMVCVIMIKIIIMTIIHQTSSNAWEQSAIPNVQCRRLPSSQPWVGNCCEPILSPVIIHSSISRRILSRWYRYHTVIKIISADHYKQLQHESPSHTSN